MLCNVRCRVIRAGSVFGFAILPTVFFLLAGSLQNNALSLATVLHFGALTGCHLNFLMLSTVAPMFDFVS